MIKFFEYEGGRRLVSVSQIEWLIGNDSLRGFKSLRRTHFPAVSERSNGLDTFISFLKMRGDLDVWRLSDSELTPTCFAKSHLNFEMIDDKK